MERLRGAWSQSSISWGTNVYNINVFKGGVLSAYGDIVVVSFNYRLGAFGFLQLNSKVSGNMGLYDQVWWRKGTPLMVFKPKAFVSKTVSHKEKNK